jgi:hypothetical protein
MRSMQKFFKNYDSINQFSLSLEYHQNKLECIHCLKSDQFVSHGIIYKQRSSAFAEKVGKRLFCSNRSSRNGCGRTYQLTIANEVPSFRYGASELFIFITALLANVHIGEAYYQATGQLETRNAWRWLKKINGKLSDYRSFLKTRVDIPFSRLTSRCNSLRHLLPTFSRLFTLGNNGCVHYQISQQQPFF